MEVETIKTGDSLPFGYLRQVGIRVVEIRDETVSEVVGMNNSLEEWWLVPNNVFAWGPSDLEAARSNGLNELIDKITKDIDYQLMSARIKNLIYQSRSRVNGEIFQLTFQSRLVDGIGQVISIICGNKVDVKVYEDKKRPVRA